MTDFGVSSPPTMMMSPVMDVVTTNVLLAFELLKTIFQMTKFWQDSLTVEKNERSDVSVHDSIHLHKLERRRSLSPAGHVSSHVICCLCNLTIGQRSSVGEFVIYRIGPTGHVWWKSFHFDWWSRNGSVTRQGQNKYTDCVCRQEEFRNKIVISYFRTTKFCLRAARWSALLPFS